MEDKEHTRKTSDAIVVSTYPDVCKSPIAPVPYTIVAPFMRAENLAEPVHATSDPTFTKASIIPIVIGDEGGTGEGVVSGTHAGSGVCWPIEWSPTVRAQGENVVRNDDKFKMNKGNTEGKVVYPGGGLVQGVKDFWKNHNVGTRLEGVGNAISGVGEVDLGAGIAAVPGLEVLGGLVALHGADVAQAGATQAWTGQETPTLTSQYFGQNVDDAMSLPGGVDNVKSVYKVSKEAVEIAQNGTRITRKAAAIAKAVKDELVAPYKNLPGDLSNAWTHLTTGVPQ